MLLLFDFKNGTQQPRKQLWAFPHDDLHGASPFYVPFCGAVSSCARKNCFPAHRAYCIVYRSRQKCDTPQAQEAIKRIRLCLWGGADAATALCRFGQRAFRRAFPAKPDFIPPLFPAGFAGKAPGLPTLLKKSIKRPRPGLLFHVRTFLLQDFSNPVRCSQNFRLLKIRRQHAGQSLAA